MRASRERVYDAVSTADLTGGFVVRALLLMRGMGLRPARTIRDFASGFRIVAEDRPNEIMLGTEGPFWKPACRPRGLDAEDFRLPVPEGVARAAWNFTTETQGDATLLATETRVLCADDARPKFRMYWMLIRPFSGIIRRMMLRAIRKAAER